MSAYLFVYFTSDEEREKEHIWFSVSRDGLHWRDLGKEEPALTSNLGTTGIRDPFMVYDENLKKYFIIATDLKIGKGGDWWKAQHQGSRSIHVWESENLIHWSRERLVEVGIPGAGCVWAPEAIFCNEESKWFVFWASMVKEPQDTEPKQRIYGSFTEDFKIFTPAFKYIEAQNHVIDTDIVWSEGWYYRFSKDETFKLITLERCRHLIPRGTERYEKVDAKLLSQIQGVEGPECYYIEDKKKWCLIVDQFAAQKGYMPLLAENLATGDFIQLSPEEYDMAKRKKRHGGVIAIPDEAAERMIAHYGFDKVL